MFFQVPEHKELRVGLTDLLNQPTRNQPDLNGWTTVEILTQCTTTPTDENPIPQPDLAEPIVDETSAQCTTLLGDENENPFALTDEQFNELLKGLEEIDDKFLRDFEESGIPVDCDIDTELNAVLNMCVGDYMV